MDGQQVMPAFERALAFLLAQEGGYVNDPSDTGGETNFGLSRRSYPNEDIKGLTRDRAAFLYHEDYWRPIRGDDIPEPLALVLFDWAVNSGVPTAILALQKLLGVKIDGKFGPETRAAAVRMPQAKLVTLLLEERLESLILQAQADPRKTKYLVNGSRPGAGGWTGRIVELSMLVGRMLA